MPGKGMFAPDRSLSKMLVHYDEPPREWIESVMLNYTSQPDLLAELPLPVADEPTEAPRDEPIEYFVHPPAQEMPAPGTAEVSRWKPRMSARQLADAEVARRHFSAAYTEVTQVPAIGASSQKLAIAPTFLMRTNILYSHPSFGHMPDWAESGVGSPKLPLLPPVSSRKAATVPAASRRAARVNWGTTFPRSAFPRNDLPLSALPASPSKHCFPSPPLPAAPKLRARTCHVDKDTSPWMRLPPHTAHQKALYEAAFGPSPKVAKQKKQTDAAARKLQSVERGRSVRKNSPQF